MFSTITISFTSSWAKWTSLTSFLKWTGTTIGTCVIITPRRPSSDTGFGCGCSRGGGSSRGGGDSRGRSGFDCRFSCDFSRGGLSQGYKSICCSNILILAILISILILQKLQYQYWNISSNILPIYWSSNIFPISSTYCRDWAIKPKSSNIG